MLHGRFSGVSKPKGLMAGTIGRLEKFLVAAPMAITGLGMPMAGGCCGRPAREGVDVDFVRAVVADIANMSASARPGRHRA